MSRMGRGTLVIGLVAVVLMAFRVSWNALSDVARAIGADPTAALLYPIVIDGLMALALVATLVLTGTDRRFALRVLATYTIASLLLNYVHGLIPALHTESVQQGRLTDWAPANWALVLLATSLPVGSIYFGSDLVAKVLHHHPDSAGSADVASAQSVDPQADESAGEQAPRSRSDQAESTPVKVDEAPATRPTGAAPRRAPSRRPASTKSTTDRTRTDTEILNAARLLTAKWSTDRLTAESLRRELHIGQERARALRDQLKAERTSAVEPVAYDGVETEPLDGRGDASSPPQAPLDTAPASAA
ncbi:DUF2637 domain-containing protein [Streptomyces sp. NPDC051913]|uniref:DUF2637 domain-containing protein n=1 Tax=Streptomyces sp. NPDC051913 TaxID=3365676 RepID=UPI0037D90BA5